MLLSILAPVPLVAFVLFLGDSPRHEVWIVAGVVIVLAIVAIALGMLVPRASAHTAVDKLTRGTYGRRK